MAALQNPAAPPAASILDGLSTTTIIIIAVAVPVGLILALVCILYLCKCCCFQKAPPPATPGMQIMVPSGPTAVQQGVQIYTVPQGGQVIQMQPGQQQPGQSEQGKLAAAPAVYPSSPPGVQQYSATLV